MARTTLIWDHHTVRIWRTSRSAADLIQEAEVADVAALLALLDSAEETLQVGRLRVYLDIPALDHHLEHVPKMAPKLQRQLLEQRKLKLYGEEDRTSVATEMGCRATARISSILSAVCRMKFLVRLAAGHCATVYYLTGYLACRTHCPASTPPLRRTRRE